MYWVHVNCLNHEFGFLLFLGSAKSFSPNPPFLFFNSSRLDEATFKVSTRTNMSYLLSGRRNVVIATYGAYLGLFALYKMKSGKK